MRLAAFITPHGLGHASRALAVLDALAIFVPSLEIEIFGSVPESMLADSCRVAVAQTRLDCDPGLQQRSPTRVDLAASIQRLQGFYSEAPALAAQLAKRLRTGRFDWVLCDIAPLGLMAAEQAALPAVLLENFTWDWIYAHWREPALARLAASLPSTAELHIQAMPFCRTVLGAVCVPPISRPLRDPAGLRQRLGLASGQQSILLTMGGIGGAAAPGLAAALARWPRLQFFTGFDSGLRASNLRRLPIDAGLYHPDLIAAVDGVVAKLGYSTVAEVYRAGTPFAGIPRQDFRESVVMAPWCVKEMNAQLIAQQDYDNGSWIEQIDTLLAQPRRQPGLANGALIAAQAIAERFG